MPCCARSATKHDNLSTFADFYLFLEIPGIVRRINSLNPVRIFCSSETNLWLPSLHKLTCRARLLCGAGDQSINVVFLQVIAGKAKKDDLRDVLAMVRNTNNPQVRSQDTQHHVACLMVAAREQRMNKRAQEKGSGGPVQHGGGEVSSLLQDGQADSTLLAMCFPNGRLRRTNYTKTERETPVSEVICLSTSVSIRASVNEEGRWSRGHASRRVMLVFMRRQSRSERMTHMYFVGLPAFHRPPITIWFVFPRVG